MIPGVEAAGGHRVQQRLPYMRPGTVYQGDTGAAFASQPVPQLRHEFQAGCATPDHDNLVQRSASLDPDVLA
jgi:hypothetical protein